MKTHILQRNIRGAAFAALTFAALALLPGCRNEDNSTSSTGQGTLSFTLGGISEGETESVTRAQAAESESVSQELGDGLILTSTITPDATSTTKSSTAMTSGKKYKLVVLDGSNNIVGSVDGVAGTETSKIPVSSGTSYTVVAYSFNDASSSLPDPGSVGTAIGSIAVPAGTDLLYFSTSVAGTSGTTVVPITFTRKASKVNVVVDASSLSDNVTAAAATLGKSYATTLALSSGNVSTSGTASTTGISWSTLGSQSVTSSDATLFSNGETPLTLTFSSLTIGTTVYATSSSTKSTTFSRALEAGKSYTLTVNAHKAIPSGITLTGDQKYFVSSIYDEDYLPYTAPTTTASTATLAAGGTTETLINYQGTITTTSVTVKIPVTVTTAGTLPAYSTTATVSSDMIQSGTSSSQTLTLSWTSQSLTTSTTSITATIKAVGGTLYAKKLDVNRGVGNDYLGVLLAQFSYPYNNAGATTTYSVRDIAAIPDRKYFQYDTGSTTSYEHQFLYLPVTAEDGNIWLSNNLGADYTNVSSSSFSPAQQATSATDYHAYGSLFQWGRNSDGHELITWTSGTAGTAKYGTTSTLSTTDTPTSALFIINSTSPSDWRSTQNDLLWQGVSGINNPCPSDFRVPTAAEFTTLVSAAGITNYTNAASSKLKFPIPAGRNIDGTFIAGPYGLYWSSTVSGTIADYYGFFNGGTWVNTSTGSRSRGLTVRCIKN